MFGRAVFFLVHTSDVLCSWVAVDLVEVVDCMRELVCGGYGKTVIDEVWLLVS